MSSGALERFLTLTSVLPVSKDGDSSSSETLSLKQLIAVNESLLDSISLTCNHTKGSSYSSINPFDTITGPLLQEEVERTLCNIILSSSNSEPQRVLTVVQYLLRLSKLKAEDESSFCERGLVLESFTNITLPLLLERSHDYDIELREAILDATFNIKDGTSGCRNTPFDHLRDILLKCTSIALSSSKSLLNESSSSKVPMSKIQGVVEITCRMFGRTVNLLESSFLHLTKEQKEDCSEIIIESMHELSLSILTSLCYYSEDGNQLVANGRLSSTLLRTVTAILLPLVYSKAKSHDKSTTLAESHERRVLELWSLVLSLIGQSDDNGVSIGNRRKRCRTW
jgi:hypothetical protein